jgi:signal recognition particle receptor subunit beta
MRETASIVYWGPGLSGKSTNLAVVSEVLLGVVGSDGMRLLQSNSDTRSSDRVCIELVGRKEKRAEMELLAPPGQAHCREMRRLSLARVEGVVFVADSSASAVAANLAALDELELLLGICDRELSRLPLVFQFNKCDLRDALSIPRLEELLNPGGRPSVEAIAAKGVGVFPALKLLLREIEAGKESSEQPLQLHSNQPSGIEWRTGGGVALASVSEMDEFEFLADGEGKRTLKSVLAGYSSPWLIAVGVLGGALFRELIGLLRTVGV